MVKDTVTKKVSNAQKRKAVKPTEMETDSAPPAKIQEIDLYAQVVNCEEAEGKARNPDDDAKLFTKTCKEISKLLIEIAEAKANPSESNTAKVRENQSKITAKIIHLKKLNRLEKMRMKECRDALQKYREQVDNDHLHLQNLVYENLHLSKEVTKCYGFKSVDEDMDLVPLDEFFASAPPNIKKDVSEETPHELKLARLSWELAQRKELASKLKQLEVTKETITKDIEAKKEHLNNLTPHLKTILESTKPLQALLNLPIDKTKKMQELALLLPNPMYILYVQADAFSQLAKWLSVSVVGKPEEVNAQNRTYDNVSSADSDSENETGRHRKQVQDRRKSGGKRYADPVENRKELCLKRHPLGIKLAVSLSNGATATLTFQWMVTLEIVCVHATISGVESSGVAVADILTSSSLLSALFPSDTGSKCPNPSASYHLERAGLNAFPSDVPSLGVPYLWAQSLCGLTFMPNEPSPSVKVCQQSLEKTLRVILDRFHSRIALAKEVKLLESGEALRAKKIQAEIRSFSAVTLNDFSRADSGAQMLADGIVDGSHLIYKASIDIGCISMTSFVALPPTYPQVLPIFVLEMNNNKSGINLMDHIRDIEREVNTSGELETEGEVLLQQVHKLLLCTEVLAAIEFNPDQPIKATYFRSLMGRKRSHPYHFMPTAGGIFTHR